jgi:radical SAM family uncharacterized protein
LEDFLLEVRKPGRYIGGEWNIPEKDFAGSPVKFALCFPDLYEVGMSNLGSRIIYGLLNQMPEVSCERFFSPAVDMENILRREKLELSSLETKRKLREFDLIGFSLSHELCYTNVLNMLELGGIPLSAVLRNQDWPLIIGGGSCVLNPEPMHEFFDLFVIGEAEEAILEIVETYRKHKDNFKSGKLSKNNLLVILAAIEGVYAPSLYEPAYNTQGKIEKFNPKVKGVPAKIKKRFIADLDNAFFPSQWLVPYIEIIHDRIILEIMRGCPNQCRFCQARNQYYPFRIRNVKKAFELAVESYKRSGYEELSLVGLSVSDYPHIEDLVGCLVGAFKDNGIAISLPSIKPKANVGHISSTIAGIKKTSLTFAPEAATERLRRILNKDFDVDTFFKTLKEAYLAGYQRVKLYFMIGVPGEKDTDLDAIVDFANQVSKARKDTGLAPGWVSLSINTLIPKPHTALQWMGMESLEDMEHKQSYLKKKIKNKRIELNFHDRNMTFLEGVLSRGDRRLSKVVLTAFKKGARFDAWKDHFVFSRWLEALEESGINPHFYLEEKSKEEVLPWDFLDVGIDKRNLSDDCAFF